MTTRAVFETAAAALLVTALAVPAAAQFNPQFNHLKCYSIKDKPVATKILLDNQFGRELVAKLTAKLLCVPTRKICCDTTAAGTAGCQPVACPADPTPNQPAPVDHFKCYKIGVKSCADSTDAACTNTVAFKKINPSLQVLLRDQFTQEGPLVVGKPQFLCAPVTKIVIGSTTTTTATTTTSTTTIPCHLDAAGACAGDCPQGMKCLFQSTPAPAGCNCVDSGTMCMPQSDGSCGGLCPKATDVCQPSTDPVVPCDCGPPSTTTTTTTTIPCRDVSQPGQPPMCAGDCPPTQGFQCVFISGVGCHCEIGCALQGTACNQQLCPKAGQQCIPNANSPCSCCFPPGSGPCAAGSDCCSGTCSASTCQ